MVDNIIGAIARAVIADVSGSAVEDIVTAVTANLPLKEDTDEYDTVFKMFAALLAAQHPAFPRFLVFNSNPNTDQIGELSKSLVLSAVRAHDRASGSLRQAAGEELLLLICGSKEQYRQLRDLRMSDETVLPFLHARQRRDAPRAAAAADCVLPPGQSGEAR